MCREGGSSPHLKNAVLLKNVLAKIRHISLPSREVFTSSSNGVFLQNHDPQPPLIGCSNQRRNEDQPLLSRTSTLDEGEVDLSQKKDRS